ncbi:hypothetical protein SLEP1_g3732 [Rubroshorea leprosula]|uniref:Uncharacterized protein n=1 Tax=Rubroshorea leprosula TaxID=152421 RepID=A0AAV5HU09_9ROSI|nr:hypothetical protein SLEP1_g3732 [Rubroshorea leprosula]
MMGKPQEVTSQKASHFEIDIDFRNKSCFCKIDFTLNL